MNLPTTVRTSFAISALMYIRPLRSVWSVPHRLGTFITQRLWTFIIQAAQKETNTYSTAGRSQDYLPRGRLLARLEVLNRAGHEMGMIVGESGTNTNAGPGSAYGSLEICGVPLGRFSRAPHVRRDPPACLSWQDQGQKHCSAFCASFNHHTGTFIH